MGSAALETLNSALRNFVLDEQKPPPPPKCFEGGMAMEVDSGDDGGELAGMRIGFIKLSYDDWDEFSFHSRRRKPAAPAAAIHLCSIVHSPITATPEAN
jgi:hypothetical protein